MERWGGLCFLSTSPQLVYSKPGEDLSKHNDLSSLLHCCDMQIWFCGWRGRQHGLHLLHSFNNFLNHLYFSLSFFFRISWCISNFLHVYPRLFISVFLTPVSLFQTLSFLMPPFSLSLSIFTHKDFQHLTVPVFFIYPPPPLSLIFSGLSLVLNRQISAGTVAVNTAAPQSLLTHYLSSKERQRRKCSPRSPSFFLSILNDTAAPNWEYVQSGKSINTTDWVSFYMKQ